jgi:uncharacterized protein (TIGR03083 family)
VGSPLGLAAGSGFEAGFDQVLDALGQFRVRTIRDWAALPDDAWSAASRCEAWSVHDVVRHVRDVCRIHAARLGGAPPPFPSDVAFDPREAPDRWLERSAGERPAETIADLAALAAAEAEGLAGRDPGSVDIEDGPYGPVHWTVLSTHVFWDAWLHERDVRVASALPHAATEGEDVVAAAYGFLVATMPATFAGTEVAVTVELTTTDGRTVAFDVGAGRVVQLDTPPERADLHGPLLETLDALAGRGPELATVLDGDPARREPLTWLRPFLVPT